MNTIDSDAIQILPKSCPTKFGSPLLALNYYVKFVASQIMEETSAWTPPEYDFSSPTIKASHTPYVNPSDFARQARWCADGSCILANTEGGRFQLLASERLHEGASKLDIQAFSQASPIVEFAWFPSASMLNPATFCFAASVRDCPVKLLHGTDGRVCNVQNNKDNQV